jgi:hypothetical protein
MTSTTKGIIAVGTVAILGFIAYRLFIGKSLKAMQEELWLWYLQSFPATLPYKDTYLKTEIFSNKDFVDSWYKSYKKGLPTFEYRGKTWDTKTAMGV